MNKIGLFALVSVLLVSAASASSVKTFLSTSLLVHSAFQNGNVVYLNATSPGNCTSTISSLYQGYGEAVNASSTTNCEVGVGISNTVGMVPYYILTPAFAGLSVFGESSWNATSQGYPTYNGMTVVTTCGASGTPASCNTVAPTSYYYSPGTSNLERSLGISTGAFNLPEGVLPKSAHDILLPSSVGSSAVWGYEVRIAVFDPNIFPNSTTGLCTQSVPSNQTNPTANCLNNTAALARALRTIDSAVTTANAHNPVFAVKGVPPYQATLTVASVTSSPSVVSKKGGVITGSSTNVTTVSTLITQNVNASNTNVRKLLLLASASQFNSTAPTPTTTAMTNVTAPPTTAAVSNQTSISTTSPSAPSGSSTTLIVGVIVVIVILVAAYWLLTRKK